MFVVLSMPQYLPYTIFDSLYDSCQHRIHSVRIMPHVTLIVKGTFFCWYFVCSKALHWFAYLFNMYMVIANVNRNVHLVFKNALQM